MRDSEDEKTERGVRKRERETKREGERERERERGREREREREREEREREIAGRGRGSVSSVDDHNQSPGTSLHQRFSPHEAPPEVMPPISTQFTLDHLPVILQRSIAAKSDPGSVNSEYTNDSICLEGPPQDGQCIPLL